MSGSLEALAFGELDVKSARDIIAATLSEPDGPSLVTSALTRWTWRSLIEGRLDSGLQPLHRLLLDSAAKMAANNRGREDNLPEKLKALADLVRLSIEASEITGIKDLDPNSDAAKILLHLWHESDTYVPAGDLCSQTLQVGRLPRRLTLLVANGLVERDPRAPSPRYRLTEDGRRHAVLLSTSRTNQLGLDTLKT